MTLRDAILQYTGITDLYVGDFLTALIFGFSVIFIFVILSKTLFRI